MYNIHYSNAQVDTGLNVALEKGNEGKKDEGAYQVMKDWSRIGQYQTSQQAPHTHTRSEN